MYNDVPYHQISLFHSQFYLSMLYRRTANTTHSNVQQIKSTQPEQSSSWRRMLKSRFHEFESCLSGILI